MRNTLILLIILVVLAGVYFLFIKGSGGSSIRPEEHAFAVENVDLIERIVMTKVVKDQNREKIELEKKPDGVWMVSGKYVVKDARMDNILATVSRLERAEGLNDAARKVAMERIKKTHTDVKIYGAKDQLLKHYFIGSTNQHQTGNIMLLKGAEHPFLMSRPGLTGYVSIHYSTILDNWRENLLMNADAIDLQSLELTYGSSEKSLSMDRESPDSPWIINGEAGADSAKIASYLSGFPGKVFAESFAKQDFPDKLKELNGKIPDYTFHYVTFSGIDSKIYLFNRENNGNNMFGWIDGKEELLTVQHFVFDKYLIPVDYFISPTL